MTRRVAQMMLALLLCAIFAATLGAFYLVFALVFAMFAIAGGVYLAWALAAGLAWPVTALAYVLFTTRNLRRAAELSTPAAGRAPTWTPEAGHARVEDLEHRERRNQR